MNEVRKNYKAALIGVMFDEQYQFEDILFLGISESPEQSFAIQQKEIMRLYEDFSEDDGKKPITYEESRSNYDEPISVIKYAAGYEHIYCMFRDKEAEESEYQRQVEQYQHDILYEPTFDPENGSM